MYTFENPRNAYSIFVTHSKLWGFLFGPLYLFVKRAYHHAAVAVMVVVLIVVVTPPLTTILAFVFGSLSAVVGDKALERGLLSRIRGYVKARYWVRNAVLEPLGKAEYADDKATFQSEEPV